MHGVIPAKDTAERAETLAQVIRRETGDNVFRCYQCVKCTSGCPLADRFDLTPTQVLRSLQLNDPRVLESKAIWLCASCYVCTTRCPMDIDVASAMKALCVEAKRRGVAPAIPDIDHFNSVFLRVVKLFGRVHELTFAALFNLVTRQPFKNAGLAIEMFKRGRLKLLPRFVRPPKKVAPVADCARQIAYFPGCSVDSYAAEYDHTARAAAKALDIELVVPPNWVCCGSSPAAATAPKLANLLSMHTVSSVEQMGLDTLTSPCSACFARLKASEQKVTRDQQVAREVEAQTGYAYNGNVKVQHLLDAIVDRAGLEKIASRVQTPLSGLKVACYYGCLMTRPPKITGAENPEYPTGMDDLLRVLGAEPTAWSSKTECCGNSLSVTHTPVALEMSGRILEDAQDCRAEAVVTMCPFCQTNLDARQDQMGLRHKSPILYATQLMTLAFGLGAKAALLNKNFVDPRPLLKKKNLL